MYRLSSYLRHFLEAKQYVFVSFAREKIITYPAKKRRNGLEKEKREDKLKHLREREQSRFENAAVLEWDCSVAVVLKGGK